MNMMNEKKIYSAVTVYRQRGAHLRRLEQFDKSKASYDEAHISNPQDVCTLIGLSQVATLAVRPQEAYAAAELALQLEPSDMNARNMEAKALQALSEFEKSLVMNYRGYRKRRQPPYFLEGINQGVQIIQDCIGTNAGNVMGDFLPIIIQEEQKSTSGEDELAKVPRRVSRIPKPENKQNLTQTQARKRQILQRVLASKYLGPMANDKFFLQDVIHDPRLKSANTRGSLELKDIVNDAVNTLTMRQELLHTQRPYYTIKEAEKAESKYKIEFERKTLQSERQIGEQTADKLLRQICTSVRNNHIVDVIKKAERMQLFLNTKTSRNLPQIDYYIDRLYKYVGDAYLSLHRLSYRLSERGNRRRIAFLMGLSIGRSKSYDSVIDNYPYKYVDIKEATARATATLNMCENSTKKCWLMYELSWLLSAQKNFALSRSYARRCQSKAQEIDSAVWWLNGCFALLAGDMQQGNIAEVRAEIEEAYEYSKLLPDAAVFQAFLKKCVVMVSETKQPDEQKAIKQREKLILKAMDKSQKIPTEVMFKKISTVPKGRRFSVLLIKKEKMDNISVRKLPKQRHMTIVPGPEQELPSMPKTEVPGLQLFDI